jgi:peptide-methionine (S)-S-oxide reductase
MSEELQLPKTSISISEGLELITLGAGCFWCTEAVFQRLKGVEKVVSGYSGGFVVEPSYREICNGTTGHAEVIEVYFDPKVISLTAILEVFWMTHDPTTLNRQGADAGPQYRSAIFYNNAIQAEISTNLKKELNGQKVFNSPIVTEITPFSNFYAAENHHQDYFNLNGNQPYCQIVVKPKLDKLKKFFSDRLKSE